MIVKEYKEDTKLLSEIVNSWAAECNAEKFGLNKNFDSFYEELDALQNDETATLLVLYKDDKPVGLMGVVIFVSPIGTNRIANEHFWYVLPNHRGVKSIRLIEEAILWAKDNGCSHVMMNASCLASDLHDKVCDIYEMMGMKKYETVYLMEV